MYLETLFEKYADWKILAWFIRNPRKEIHVQGLARELGISPGTASKALKLAEKDKILNKEIVGNVHLYSLNRKSEHARKLKRVVDSL